jgi:RNase H-fold protein (predicted Holliday junction resolvase)
MGAAIIIMIIIEGSLEVKLPTIWTDEKQSRAEAERRERERRVEEKEQQERRCRCAKR